MEEKIKIKNNTGEEKEYDILFSFEKDNKKYIVFTDFANSDGIINCYSGIYENNHVLKVDEAGERIIQEMLKTMEEDANLKYKLTK